MSNIKQIFHNYRLWEDYKYGMWETFYGLKHDDFLKAAIALTGDYQVYGYWMMEAIRLWEYSCEHNLTDTAINRQAYIGHAACCLAIGCPEHITREAWHYLTQKQQNDANKEADKAISKWEAKYICQKDQLGLMF
jgi:hypothetical protein